MSVPASSISKLTVKSNNAEDENKRQNEDNDGVDLESRRLVSVESYNCMLAQIPTHTPRLHSEAELQLCKLMKWNQPISFLKLQSQGTSKGKRTQHSAAGAASAS